MSRQVTFRDRLRRAVTMFVVSALSLILLVYVGYGEAQRNYEQFMMEKLAAQGRIVQNAMGSYLRAGLPIKQYVGFSTLVNPILESDRTISSIFAVDRNGRVVFGGGDDAVPLLPHSEGAVSPVIDREIAAFSAENIQIRESDTYYQVILPLRNKFERVGGLAVTMPRAAVDERLERSFPLLVALALGLSLAFALFVSFGGISQGKRGRRLLPIVYVLIFLTMAGAVIGTLVSLYSEGAQTRTKALADSLGQRLADIVEFNLNINEFEGLDQTFGEYRRLNPDISSAGLIVNGRVLIHTDPKAVGRPWVRPPRVYEYVVNLTRWEKSSNEVNLAVTLPTAVVYQRVTRTVKNFAALFIACGFLAALFLQLAGSVERAQSLGRRLSGGSPVASGDEDAALNLVKPVFFLAVFAEHLTYSFLPQFMQQAAKSSGLSEAFASGLFMTYYLCFALTLIPAGHVSQRHGPRPLMHLGLLLSGIGLLSLAVPASGYFLGSSSWAPAEFLMVMAARAVSGIGQAMLFIGVQTYILNMASPRKMTQGAAIIVFGFQGGMISGMAIGSLLVVYMGMHGVFTLGTIIASGMALYALLLLPSMALPENREHEGLNGVLRGVGRDMREVFRSFEFVKTMTLVGIPTKAVMTGVILFALPLLLSKLNYAQEDIGQIIMIYAVGVLVASVYAPRFVDRTRRSDVALFWGTAVSGLGLMMIGVMGWEPVAILPNATTVAVIAGVLVVGLAHGFVYAPVVTHVAHSCNPGDIGAGSVAATYRFLERIGHVLGPMIVGQLFLLGGQNSIVVAWVGVSVIVCALLFLLRVSPTPTPTDLGESRSPATGGAI